MGLLLHHPPETVAQPDAAPPPSPPSAQALMGRWLLAGALSGMLLVWIALAFVPKLRTLWFYAMHEAGFGLELLDVGRISQLLLLALLMGLATGGIQALVARPTLPTSPLAWVVASIVGVAVGLLASYLTLAAVNAVAMTVRPVARYLLTIDPVVWVMVGVGVGVAQGWAMRGGPSRVFGWAAACGLGSVLAWGLVLWLAGALDLSIWSFSGQLERLVGVAGLLGALAGLVYGLVTGPALVWLLRGSARRGA
jgi:hypothetical protein